LPDLEQRTEVSSDYGSSGLMSFVICRTKYHRNAISVISNKSLFLNNLFHHWLRVLIQSRR